MFKVQHTDEQQIRLILDQYELMNLIIIITIIIIIIIVVVVVVVMIIIIIIVIIIIPLKGTIRDFVQSPHCTVNCLQHARSSGLGAIMWKSHAAHRVFIMCSMSCATWCKGTVPHGMKGHLSY